MLQEEEGVSDTSLDPGAHRVTAGDPQAPTATAGCVPCTFHSVRSMAEASCPLPQFLTVRMTVQG